MIKKVRAALSRFGYGIWLAVIANLYTIGFSLSFLTWPAGTWVHGGATEFSLVVSAGLIGIVVLPVCIYDLIKRRWWAVVGAMLTCSPLPVSWALCNYIFSVKHFHTGA